MERDELEKTVEMLTPKFRKSSDFSFVRREKRMSMRQLWWRAGSVAAMVAVVVALAINTLTPARAEDVVQKSLANLNAESSYKVEFYIAGTLKENEIRPEPGGDREITGTLYVVNDNGVEKDRIEIESPDKITEVYDGEWYMRYKNGTLVKKVRSKTLGLLDLFRFNTLKDMMKDVDIASNGDSITVSHKKGQVVMHGVFSRSTNKLTEAYVTMNGERVLGTKSIEYGTDIPEEYFK